MASTRTSGITVNTNGEQIINKEHYGLRLFLRLGPVSQDYVILNDAAWSIVQTQREKHPIWVFPYKSNAVRTMNNTAWQKARRAIGLPSVRVHDLRHTYGARLRAGGVSHEDRAALLGHAHHTMPTFYASPDICRLMELANRVLERIKTVTIVRIACG